MSAAVLQKKVIEFASLMSTSAKGSDAMDLGRLERQRKEAAASRRWEDYEDWEDKDDPWLAQDWDQEATPGSGPVLAAVDTK